MGFGGAFIMPSTLSILTNIFPPKERGRAIAIWTATAGIAIPLGPVIGGWLLEHFWWGSVFLVNVPIIAIALIAGFFLMPESKDPEHASLDPVGAVLSIAGLGVLLYGIIEAPNNGWLSHARWIAFVAGAVAAGGVRLLGTAQSTADAQHCASSATRASRRRVSRSRWSSSPSSARCSS